MSLYGVIGYHVTLSEGHMIANHPTYKETLVPHLVATLIYLSQNYSYYIRGDRSHLSKHLKPSGFARQNSWYPFITPSRTPSGKENKVLVSLGIKTWW